MCDLKHSNNTLAIAHHYHWLSGIHLDASEFEVLCGLISLFAGVCECIIEAFDDVDVGEGPAVTEVPPHKHTHVLSTGDEGVRSHSLMLLRWV